jgi:hypothetical protein
LVAREIRHGNFKGKHELNDFMLIDPAKRNADRSVKKGVFDFFKSIAKRKPMKEEGK